MKWRDLALTIAVLLILAPYLSAQTAPVGTQGGVASGIFRLTTGSASAPSLAFQSNTNSGLYDGGSGTPTITVGGTAQARFQSNQLALVSGELLSWSSGDPTVSASDVAFARRGTASLALSNAGTGPASFQTTGTAVTLAIPAGGLGLATVATSSVGITGQGARLVVVCGPTSGTSSLLYYSGTSNTPVTLANAVGGGLIGC